MYNHSLHHERKHYCLNCLQAFSSEEIWEIHIKNCFKSNGKQRIIMSRKPESIKFKYYGRKINWLFTIYADFKSILVPKNNEKQNTEESYSYEYKLACAHDKFSKPLKTYFKKIQFTISWIVSLKKVNIVMKWWKKIWGKNLWWLKKTINILSTLLNVGSVIMILLILVLK